jgi:hypothetical protein
MSGFEGSGALAGTAQAVTDRCCSSLSITHKVYGPQNNDLALRKHGISKVVLAGMSANLCVRSHMRDPGEQEFEVFVVMDATAAAARDPKLGDGCKPPWLFQLHNRKVLTTRGGCRCLALKVEVEIAMSGGVIPVKPRDEKLLKIYLHKTEGKGRLCIVSI